MSEQILSGSVLYAGSLADTNAMIAGPANVVVTEVVHVKGQLQDADGNNYIADVQITSNWNLSTTPATSAPQSGIGVTPGDSYTVTITKN